MKNEQRFIPDSLICSDILLRQQQWQVVGRVIKKFQHRSVILMSINDNGTMIPLVIKKGVATEYALYQTHVCLGDIIAADGVYAPGRGGRQELQVHSLKIVKACSLSAEQTGLLPDNHYTGAKAKQYYHTLMTTDEMCIFLLRARSQMLHALQQTLDREGYVNCTTPVLQHSHFAGGSRPFITHMLDNNADMYLRVTSEIALKHIIAGGLNRVYEIGHSFRNGSVNAMHNTPFMGAEIYQAYCTEPEHRAFAVFVMEQIQKAVRPLFQAYGYEIKVDLSGRIPVMTFEEYVRSKGYSDFRIEDPSSYPTLHQLGVFTGVEHNDAKLLYKWFKNTLIQDQISPILITDQPSGISPLIARKTAHTLHRTYLVANGVTLMEIAQSETDSQLVQQALAAQQAQNGEQAYPCDYTALLHAYRFGIPPMCSLFIGIDRIIPAMLGAQSINQYQMYL